MAAAAAMPAIMSASLGVADLGSSSQVQGSTARRCLLLDTAVRLLLWLAAFSCCCCNKGGGFLARDWGSGPTTALHQVSFQLHAELAKALDIKWARRIQCFCDSRAASGERMTSARGWMATSLIRDGWTRCGAQVAPYELCTKLMKSAESSGAELKIGTVEGVEKEDGRISHVIVDGEKIPCKAFVCTMGPWAALAQDWFDMPVPMTGIKSTSIVFKDSKNEVEPYALFCGEDDRFGTHLEVYPRNSGEVYLCGIGGSEYVDADELRAGKYPPGEVHADPKRVEAATKSFSTMSNRLGGTPETVQACMRPCPPDALPYMGKVQGFENAYMSAGHNCWGILWAPVSGKAMSELILDGKSSCVDLKAFDPARFKPKKSGGRGRKMREQDVGEQW